ncbi:MAG: isoamylase early set domain-containing protein [Endomicrobia bacterium]|nr:isoamylase early set domain-containing protein [Endomicrobiia bacterium]
MKCKTLKLLDKYLEDKLSQNQKINIQQHLLSCNICQEYLKLEEKLKELKNIKPLQAPENLTAKIFANISFPKNYILFSLFSKQNFVLVGILFLLVLWFPLTKKLYQRKITVRFEINFPTAHSVAIAGDFNKWNFNKTKCKNQNGKWVAEVAVKPGRYQYMFVIDKELWIPDPNAKEFIYDSFGKKNSVLDTYVYGK